MSLVKAPIILLIELGLCESKLLIIEDFRTCFCLEDIWEIQKKQLPRNLRRSLGLLAEKYEHTHVLHKRSRQLEIE
jgi:hypothetical protein